MSEEIRELGEVAYVGYFKASGGKSLISGADLPAWDEQAPEIRQAWNLGAMAVVDYWREADAEPEPAKVIVVTERDRLGRVARELRYDASQAEVSEYGILRVLRKGRTVGEHQGPGGFSWREEGAIAYDGPADKRKLAIALEALQVIAASGPDEDSPFVTLTRAATRALEDIADVDL